MSVTSGADYSKIDESSEWGWALPRQKAVDEQKIRHETQSSSGKKLVILLFSLRSPHVSALAYPKPREWSCEWLPPFTMLQKSKFCSKTSSDNSTSVLKPHQEHQVMPSKFHNLKKSSKNFRFHVSHRRKIILFQNLHKCQVPFLNKHPPSKDKSFPAFQFLFPKTFQIVQGFSFRPYSQ